MPNKKQLNEIETLATEEPASLIARLRAVWPQVHRAIQAGHSLRVIGERLNQSGLDISYELLRVYRRRIERKNKKVPTAGVSSVPDRISDAPKPSVVLDRKSKSFDPLANLHEQEAKQVKWQYPSGPPDESKLI